MQRESAKRKSAATLRKIGEEITRVTGASAPESRGDTKSASDFGRAKRQKKKPAYRKASREVYKAATPAQRKDVRGGKTPESAVARKQSSDFKRAEGYKREAQKFLDKGPTRADLEKITGPRRERLDKGLRVLSKQAKAAELRNALNPQIKPLEHVKSRKSSGISALPGVGDVVGAITDIGGTIDAAKSLATGEHRRRRPVAEEARARVEEKLGPLDDVQKKVIKTAADGTTKALTQLTRPASAIAGGVTDLSLKSAVKGFAENNRSFEELARKAGADGTLAEVLGLAGDIAFDPTTYVTLGAGAPLTAARKSAQESAQRALNAEGRKIAKEVKAGKLTAEQAGKRLDAAAATQRANLERVLAKPTAKAQKQRLASKTGEQPRALQVGMRAAGRQKQVSVRVPGSRKAGDKLRAAQQKPGLNDLTTKLSTKAPGIDVSRPQKDILREIDRGKRGESNTLIRKAERVAHYFKKQKYTEPETRQIIDAIEAGTIAKLEPRLREGAVRFKALTDEGRDRLESLLGREVDLDERMLAPGELEELAKRVGREAERAILKAEGRVRKAEAGVAAAEREISLTRRVGANTRDPEFVALERTARQARQAADSARRDLRRAKEEAREGAKRVKRGLPEGAVRVPPQAADRLRDAIDRADEAVAVARELRDAGVEKRALTSARDEVRASRAALQKLRESTVKDAGEAMGERAARRVADADAVAAEAADTARGAKETLRGYKPDRVLPTQKASLGARAAEAAALREAAERARGAAADASARAVDRESERAVVARLRETVDALDTERLPLAVNRRVKEVIGEVRKGGVAAEAYPDLAKALKEADEARAVLRETRDAGVETKAVIAARKRHVAARAVIKEHHAAIARATEGAMAEDGMRAVTGRTGRMLENAERKVAKETPEGYVPRVGDLPLRAKFGDEEAAKQVRAPRYTRVKAESEHARVQNRERRSQMEPQALAGLSADMTLLAANYGLNVANRIYRGGVLQEVFQRFGMRPTAEVIENAPSELVAYRRVAGDIPKRLDEKETRALLSGEVDDIDGLFVIPKSIDDEITAMQNAPNRGELAQRFRSTLRKWKEFNTIARPGFFVNNFVSNNWQLFLADAKREIAGQFVTFSRLKADELLERNGTTGFAKILDKLGAQKTYTLLDGKRMTTSDLLIEGGEAGALRTGSRLGYRMDEDLSPVEMTKRQLAGPKQALRWGSTKAGNLAEDFDDMTRGALYVRARTKLGMSRQEATEYVYTVMIDYGDLTDFEQRFIKNAMPFYVYTSRNLPIQVKKLMQRPGKVANFEKVVEELADLAGLPGDWEGMLSESDQERMPVPVPQGLAKAIRSIPGGSAIMPEGQSFRDIRLPVGDLRRPAQALDGVEGLARLAKMYGADVGPYFRAPLELAFNRRLDFDRPIYGPESTPAEAGSLVTAFEKLAGLDSRKTEEFSREKGKYNPTSNQANYLLRALGSYPSLALGVGTKGADRTGRTIGVRTADSLLGQGSMVPNVNETLLYGNVSEKLDKAFEERNKLEDGSAAYYRKQDEIDKLKEVKAGLTLLAGIQGRTGERAERDAKSGQKRRMRPGSKAAIDTSGDLRALDASIRKIREAVQP